MFKNIFSELADKEAYTFDRFSVQFKIESSFFLFEIFI